MTDEDDRRKQQVDRRHPSEKDETAMPRRAHDSSRVRAAIRTELEEVAEDNLSTQTETRPLPRVISIENVSLAFDEPILENVSFSARSGETIVVVGESGTDRKSTRLNSSH